jgi:hypothetical protein
MDIDVNIWLIIDDSRGILDQQLRPHPIHFLNIFISIKSYIIKLFLKTGHHTVHKLEMIFIHDFDIYIIVNILYRHLGRLKKKKKRPEPSFKFRAFFSSPVIEIVLCNTNDLYKSTSRSCFFRRWHWKVVYTWDFRVRFFSYLVLIWLSTYLLLAVSLKLCLFNRNIILII